MIRKRGWAWCGDALGSTTLIPSEAENIKRAALAIVTEGSNPRIEPATEPTDLKICGHSEAQWQSLSAIERAKFLAASLQAAHRRQESPELIEARQRLGDGIASTGDRAAVAAADRALRVAASAPGDRLQRRAIAASQKAADSVLGAELVAANAPALATVSADPVVQRNHAAGAGATAIRNARKDLETVRRTRADKTISANLGVYLAELERKAKSTLQRYGLES